MTATLRGLRDRKAHTLTLFALVVVVVSGSLTAVTFSELTKTPVGAVGALFVLGVVAISVQSAQVARDRLPEVALARIRGRSGWRLGVSYLTEPFLVLLVAGVVGFLAGRWVTAMASRRWLGDVPVEVSRVGASTVGLAVALSLAAVGIGSYQTLVRPLVEQLGRVRRPASADTWALVGRTFVMVAAVGATYQATRGGAVREDWRGLASPALLTPVLLGLAGAQIGAWLLTLAAGWLARRSQRQGRRLAAFLAARRLGRRRGTLLGATLVMTAAVVASVTVTATSSVATWQAETTRLEIGGPQRLGVEGGALTAYVISHEVDPDGRWLMAAVAAPDDSQAYRREFVDVARWDRVVGGFLASTDAADVTRLLPQLPTDESVRLSRGERAEATFVTSSLRENLEVGVTYRYVSDSGLIRTLALRAPPSPYGEDTVTVSRRLPDCVRGCAVSSVTVDGYSLRRTAGAAEMSALTFGDRDLLADGTWRVEPGSGQGPQVQSRPGRLSVLLPDYDTVQLVDAARSQTLPVVVTRGLDVQMEERIPVGYGPDGNRHRVDIRGTVEALPFLGRQGMLLDLPSSLAGATATSTGATAAILARADTPDDILTDLDETGLVSAPTGFDATLESVRGRSDAQGARLYLLMSWYAGLIAVISLAASLLAQRRERRAEAASLRLTGVKTSTIAGAYAVEAMVLALMAAVVVGAAGWVASDAGLASLSLVPTSDYLPLLESRPRLDALAAVAGAAGVMIGLISYLAHRRLARAAPATLLRIEASR